MKIATLRTASGLRPAVQLSTGEFLDLAIASEQKLLTEPVTSTTDLLDDAGAQHKAVKALIEDVETDKGGVKGRLSEAKALAPADTTSLAPPVMPRFIFSTGSAYRDHMEEMKVELPKEPAGFQKTVNSVIGPFDAIQIPATSPDMIDFESEFSCVFSRPCHNVSQDEAMAYVGGYTMINDVSDRLEAAAWIESLRGVGTHKESCDLNSRNILRKQFPTFCPVGPVVTTKDEIPDPHAVNIGSRLNGKQMQSANTDNLIFRLAHVISYFSQWFIFQPGDILTTGSPSGVGFAHNPPIFMKDGDVLETFAEGIGTMRNPVVGPGKA
ncbi:fumarylacetoacetate hydrolase family protein [Henriciella aquimarina]|uniref:fumarylacetoacetate hydrolase family protein n=1 Tax=Henriciella aquimarina TaxID=545261 RepID=UPI0009FF9834|nr:fumarylacetoacetate hydrolase family protein [Henriciella aquimarina]